MKRFNWLAGVLTLAASLPAHTVPSQFDSLVQVSVSDSVVVSNIQNNLFRRQDYLAAGARVTFNPWVWDPEIEEWVYAVAPGEEWSWFWRDLDSGALIAAHSISFVGGSQLCWSNGECGTFGSWWAALPMQCMPEGDRVRVDTYHNGQFLGADHFRPTRFVPEFHEPSMAPEIEPKRTSSGTGQSTPVGVFVTDDLGCMRPVQNARVTMASTVVGGSNAQKYFSDGDMGTGRFSSLGFNSVLNPGGPSQNDTVIQGDTDVHGFFQTQYQAQDHGVEEIITANVRRPAAGGEPEVIGAALEQQLRIAVPDLVRITEDLGPVGFVDGGGCPHDPKPHWLTPRTRALVLELAEIYHEKTARKLSLNDASLPLGGVIANRGGAGRNARCHGSHRQGIDIDINRVDMGGMNMTVETVAQRDTTMILLEFMDEMVEDLGGSLHHSHNNDGQLTSIHWRLP